MKLDFPVMLFWLLIAALVQSVIPPFHGGLLSLKLPLLPAVALYYILDRQVVLAVFATLWAGIITDAASGIPPGTSSFGLLFAALVIFGVRRYFPEASWILAGLLGAALTAFLVILQYCVLRGRCGYSAPFYLLSRPLLLLLPFSAAASAVIVTAARRLDVAAGNVEPKKEIDGQ